jgi:hypothetical protein
VVHGSYATQQEIFDTTLSGPTGIIADGGPCGHASRFIGSRLLQSR